MVLMEEEGFLGGLHPIAAGSLLFVVAYFLLYINEDLYTYTVLPISFETDVIVL